MAQVKNSKNSIRIIGGDLRSRKIEFPSITGLRPTADRVRETLFNWIQLDIPGSNCLDLFAGSGALGIESLSRGASSVTFIEKNKEIINSIQANLDKFELSQVVLVCNDALVWIDGQELANKKYDVVFIDPPFSLTIISTLCSALENKNVLSADCKIYVETGIELSGNIDFPKNWHAIKQKKAGQVYSSLFIRNSNPDT